MAVPTHFKFTFRGVFTGTPEIWSFGCHMKRTNDVGVDANIGDINVAPVTAALDTLLNGNGNATFSNVVKATDWRAYEIGTNGKMVGNPLVVDVTADNITGTGDGYKYPPQVAAVATLVALNRGPARFGRMFLPGPTGALSGDARLPIATATLYADVVTQFLKAVSDAVDLDVAQSSEGMNVSHGGGVNGTIQSVDHVEFGRVLDTLRSRRHALVEDRWVHGAIDW